MITLTVDKTEVSPGDVITFRAEVSVPPPSGSEVRLVWQDPDGNFWYITMEPLDWSTYQSVILVGEDYVGHEIPYWAVLHHPDGTEEWSNKVTVSYLPPPPPSPEEEKPPEEEPTEEEKPPEAKPTIPSWLPLALIGGFAVGALILSWR